MTTAVAHAFNPPQLEAANLLNLVIVDDERSIRDVCREVAQSLGFNTMVAESAEHTYRLIDSQPIDVVLLDLKLPGAGGLEALHKIKQRRPDSEVVVVTGYATVQSAVQAMKNGAYDYVTKPFTIDELKLLLERVAAHLRLKTENRMLREKIKSKLGFGSIVGHAPEMEKLYRMIAKAAVSSHPVLILGESGTGKEMVARSIHFSGPFRDKPFIPVDCGLWRKVARCFSMRSASSRLICRPSYCAPSRKKRFAKLAVPNARLSTCGFWPQPIATWKSRWRKAHLGATSTSA